jgi:hypothetical protein
MGRYSKEYYKEHKERILNYQRKWKKDHSIKINRQRNKYLKQKREWQKEKRKLTSVKLEDIERNVELFLDGKDLDIPLKKLGPLFKNRIMLHIAYQKKIKFKKSCKQCGKEFTTFLSTKILCSPYCRAKYIGKDFYRKYMEKIYHYHRERMKRDYKYMIKTRLRDRLRESIRFFTKTGKIRKAEEYLNYAGIIKHLGPCPGNRRDYHIDHIIPLCNFDFSKDEEIVKAFAPNNLQWLPAKENIKKGRYLNPIPILNK